MAETRTDMSSTGYDPIAKILHWAVALLIAAQFVIGIVMPGIHRNVPTVSLNDLHFSVGMLIILVVLARIVWRLMKGAPSLPASIYPTWQRYGANLLHGLLYLTLIVVPVLGWLDVGYRGIAIKFFGLFPVPALQPADPKIAGPIGDIHINLSWLMLALIGLHVVMALWHHFVRKDGALLRMMPARN